MRVFAISAAALAVLWLATSGHHDADSAASSRQGQSALHSTADFRSRILASHSQPPGEQLDPGAAPRREPLANPARAAEPAKFFSADAPWAAEAEFAPTDG